MEEPVSYGLFYLKSILQMLKSNLYYILNVSDSAYEMLSSGSYIITR